MQPPKRGYNTLESQDLLMLFLWKMTNYQAQMLPLSGVEYETDEQAKFVDMKVQYLKQESLKEIGCVINKWNIESVTNGAPCFASLVLYKMPVHNPCVAA